MRRALYLAVSACLIGGCNGLDRLTGGRTPSRDSGYDTSPSPSYTRPEPYAELSGYQPDGGKLFTIHWTGNVLNMTNVTEKTVDGLGIPKFMG